MTIRWNSHTYAGAPVFSEEEGLRIITNQSDSDKGSWIGWYQGDIAEGDQFQVVGDWSGGNVVILFALLGGGYTVQAVDVPDEIVKIPVGANRLRIDGRLWKQKGVATFNLDLEPYEEPDEELILEFVDFPESAEAGAFSLFWNSVGESQTYQVYRAVGAGDWELLGETSNLYFDTELLLEHIGEFIIFYVNAKEADIASSGYELVVKAKEYPVPPVPDMFNTKVSGWLFGTNLSAVIPEDSPIMAIFENSDEAAPVTGYLNGRRMTLFIGSPEYMISEVPESEDPTDFTDASIEPE